MKTRTFQIQLNRFHRREDGALLVFFAMCCAAIFLVAALSFDLGKRAATQTEIQSFADNVALSAAAELDGRVNAIARAETAADRLINDSMTFGEGDRNLAGADDFTVSFYDQLPANEIAWASPLASGDADNDRIARFARVEVTPVQVQWSFARVLSVFSSAPLPNRNIVAEATSGFSAMSCDVAPIFFCMPSPVSGVIWNPADHIGESLHLQTASGAASNWTTGSMGFVDVDNLTDIASPCYGLSGPELYTCLTSVDARLTQCVENGALSLTDGRVSGISERLFNVRMDSYHRSVRELRLNPNFSSAPIVTKGYRDGTTCGFGSPVPVTDATDFPTSWPASRVDYVDTNYSVDETHIGTVDPAELITVAGATYHIDDPFRPGDAANPRRPEYSDYPVVPSDAIRFHYYNAEVAAAYFEDPALAYFDGEVDISGASSALRDDPVELLDVLRPDGTVVPREGAGLPRCSRDPSLDPYRRTFVAAAVDCDTEPLDGTPAARATWFVEFFIHGMSAGDEGSGNLEIDAEIINSGLSSTNLPGTNGRFRNLVQLFR